MLAFGYAFLYIPLLSVVIYSFNDSRLATVWGGFSTRWYGELLRNDQVMSALALSFKVGVSAATLATLFGTIAGMALARFGNFRGRNLFTGLVMSPMVMPEVITGLALLLLFVSLQQVTGWPGQRGFGTITIAHTTFAIGARRRHPGARQCVRAVSRAPFAILGRGHPVAAAQTVERQRPRAQECDGSARALGRTRLRRW